MVADTFTRTLAILGPSLANDDEVNMALERIRYAVMAL